MAAHSSVLAWRIPGTGEPGGLPSMGSCRVGHDCSDLAALCSLTQLVWDMVKNPGGENGNPFQYSCLENPMDRGAWWAIIYSNTKTSVNNLN